MYNICNKSRAKQSCIQAIAKQSQTAEREAMLGCNYTIGSRRYVQSAILLHTRRRINRINCRTEQTVRQRSRFAIRDSQVERVALYCSSFFASHSFFNFSLHFCAYGTSCEKCSLALAPSGCLHYVYVRVFLVHTQRIFLRRSLEVAPEVLANNAQRVTSNE